MYLLATNALLVGAIAVNASCRRNLRCGFGEIEWNEEWFTLG